MQPTPAVLGKDMRSQTLGGDSKVVSVEEFCPDGETLDKSFLEDVPSAAPPHQQPRSNESYESDSDNENGNPLVASYHEDPGDDLPTPTLSVENAQKTIAPKVNPLSKGKNKSSAAPLNLSLAPRRVSVSSDDIEIAASMKASGSIGDGQSSGGISNEELDSWLLDTNQRRSPEGGEDVASLPSIDKSTSNDRNEQIEPNSHDDEASASTEKKEKRHKSKKKSKKDRHDKDEKSKKKKSRSKQSELEDFLTGNSSSSKSNVASETYEAF